MQDQAPPTWTGHVLQGRYKATLIDKDSYLLEVARYVVVNPVRVGMVRHPRLWPWSSYRATAGETTPPAFLTTEGILSQFHSGKDRAHAAYRQFVREGYEAKVWDKLRGGVVLGPEEFVAKLRPLLREVDREVPKKERLAARPRGLFSFTVVLPGGGGRRG